MYRDYLLSPIPVTRYIPLGAPASNEIAPNANGRFAVDRSERKTQSFFPRMASMVKNTLRDLGLIRRAPNGPPEALEAGEMYNAFMESESSIRTRFIGRSSGKFLETRLSDNRIKSMHKVFGRALGLNLSWFPDTLRTTRAEYPHLDIAQAICKAYETTVDDVLENLSGPDAASYAEAMAAPMGHVIRCLEKTLPRLAILQSSLSGPIAASASIEDLRMEKNGGICDDFAFARLEIFAKVIEKYREELGTAIDNQGGPFSLERLSNTYASHFDKCLLACSSRISMSVFQKIHRSTMDFAIQAAVLNGLPKDESPYSNKGKLMETLSLVSRDINAEVAHFTIPK